MSAVKLAAGAVAAGLLALKIALGDDVVSAGEWVEVALATLLGTGLVAVNPRKSE